MSELSRDQYDAAFHARASALGFIRRTPRDYIIPGGGILRPWHAGVALTRERWCYECEWRLIAVERDSIPALAALLEACRDLPVRFGHGYQAEAAPAVPARGGFRSGAIDDTSGT